MLRDRSVSLYLSPCRARPLAGRSALDRYEKNTASPRPPLRGVGPGERLLSGASSKHLAFVLLASLSAAPAWGFGTPNGKWFQENLGDPVHVTYSYNNLLDGGLLQPSGEPLPAEVIRASVEEAFMVWAEVAPLHFTEVEDQGGGVPLGNYLNGQFGQIRLSHRYINGPDPIGGSPTTKALAWFPGNSNIAADIHFDNGDPWQVNGTTSTPDVLGAAIHEIGHTLGLTHSNIPGTNLYWIFRRHSGSGSGMLLPDDIAAIQSVYGVGVGSVTPLPRPVPEPSTAAGLLIALSLLGVCRRRY